MRAALRRPAQPGYPARGTQPGYPAGVPGGSHIIKARLVITHRMARYDTPRTLPQRRRRRTQPRAGPDGRTEGHRRTDGLGPRRPRRAVRGGKGAHLGRQEAAEWRSVASSRPCLALPCPALSCLALPCLALPCPALPCFALPYRGDGRVLSESAVQVGNTPISMQACSADCLPGCLRALHPDTHGFSTGSTRVVNTALLVQEWFVVQHFVQPVRRWHPEGTHDVCLQ